MVAGAANKVVQSVAFTAEDQNAIASEIEAVVVRFAAFVEADDPEIAFFQFFKGANKIHNARDAKVFGRARACLNSHGAERCRSALGQYNAIDPRTVGNAQQRTEILRVFNAVQCEQQATLL